MIKLKQKNKKAQINKVFVFLLSSILIAFTGFLVIKFVFNFNSSFDETQLNKFYQKIEKDTKSIYISAHGTEKSFYYKLPSRIETLCIITDVNTCSNQPVFQNLNQNTKDNINTIISTSKENLFLLDNKDILSSKKLNNINTKCLCINRKKGNFELFMQNNRNKLIITQLD